MCPAVTRIGFPSLYVSCRCFFSYFLLCVKQFVCSRADIIYNCVRTVLHHLYFTGKRRKRDGKKKREKEREKKQRPRSVRSVNFFWSLGRAYRCLGMSLPNRELSGWKREFVRTCSHKWMRHLAHPHKRDSRERSHKFWHSNYHPRSAYVYAYVCIYKYIFRRGGKLAQVIFFRGEKVFLTTFTAPREKGRIPQNPTEFEYLMLPRKKYIKRNKPGPPVRQRTGCVIHVHTYSFVKGGGRPALPPIPRLSFLVVDSPHSSLEGS